MAARGRCDPTRTPGSPISIHDRPIDIVGVVSRRWQALWIAVLALIAFLSSLGFEAIAASHEARVAETAREMAAVGWPWNARSVEVAPVLLRDFGSIIRLVPDDSMPPTLMNPWLIPLLKGEVRLQKPPVPYWCDAVLFRLVGFSECSARLMPALLGALGTLFVYGLGVRLLGRRRAIYAAVAWVSMGFIPQTYRLAMADPYLSFFTLLCVWAWAGKRRGFDAANAQWARVLIFYGAVGLGLLSKGPVLFVHLTIALGAYHVCCKRRGPGTFLSHALGVAFALAIALPWPLYVLGHIPHAVQVWRYESVGEMTDNVENARSWWFYLPNLPTLLLPWVIVAAIACARNLGPVLLKVTRGPSGQHRPHVAAMDSNTRVSPSYQGRGSDRHPPASPSWRQTRLFPITWLCATVLFFSFVNLKKNPYLLPMMPAAALLVAQGMGSVLAGARRTRFTGWPGVIIGLQAYLGAGLAIGLVLIGYHYSAEDRLLWGVGIVTIAVAGWAIIACHQHDRIQQWVFWQATAYVLTGFLFLRFIISPQDNSRSARLLGRELAERARERGYAIMVPRLPEEVAVYVPVSLLQPRPYQPHQLVVVEKDHDPATLDRWFAGRSVLMTSEVPLVSTRGESRWKVYDVWVEPRTYALEHRLRFPGPDPRSKMMHRDRKLISSPFNKSTITTPALSACSLDRWVADVQ